MGAVNFCYMVRDQTAQVTRDYNQADDYQFEKLHTHFNDRHIVEFTPRITLYNFSQKFYDVWGIDMTIKVAFFDYSGCGWKHGYRDRAIFLSWIKF